MMNANLSTLVTQFVQGIKSRNEEDRLRTVTELCKVVSGELKEVSNQNYVICLDLLCNEFISIFSSGDLHEKKGAVMAMGCLAEVDFMSVHNHCQRFVKQLLTQTFTTDLQLITLEARFIGKLGLVFPYDFIEEQIKNAYDILLKDSTDAQKHFAILTLREFILNTPTSFCQHMCSFISAIIFALRDKSWITRELAGMTLNCAFYLTAKREQRRYTTYLGIDYNRIGETLGNFSTRENNIVTMPSRTIFTSTSSNSSSGILRHKTSQQSMNNPNPDYLMNDIMSTTSSFIWYRDCLIEAVRVQGGGGGGGSETLPLTQPEQSNHHTINLRKLSRDDWLHGNILILQGLLVCVQPQFGKLLMELDQMCGLPLFEFLTLNQTDANQAVHSVLNTRWPITNTSSILVTIGVLPGSPFCSSNSEQLSNLSLEVLGLHDGINNDCQYSQTTTTTTTGSSTLQQHHESQSKQQQQQQQHYGWENCNDLSSEICYHLLLENIDKLWSSILQWMNTRNHQIMFLLYKLIPRVVALKPDEFLDVERQRVVMEWMFQCLRKEKEKPMILLNISLICYFMGNEFAASNYLTQLFQLIRSYLPTQKDISNKKRSPTLETAAILSIGLLAKSLGCTVNESVNQLLDAMVASGLNQPLVSTFKVIAMHIPRLRKEIQDCLLANISLVLMNNSSNSFNHTHSNITNPAGDSYASTLSLFPNLINLIAGTTTTTATTTTTTSNTTTTTTTTTGGGFNNTSHSINNFPLSTATRLIFGSSTTSKNHSSKLTNVINTNLEFSHIALPGGLSTCGESTNDVAVVALALKTLGTFNFEGHGLAHFIRHICDNFISVNTCEVKEIRIEAVKTCAYLIIPWLKSTETQQWYARPAVNTVANVLNQLLTVGISDPDPDVRRCVFQSFDRRFDPHLAQSDHLNYLFSALYDEVFDIRCLVMQRLGRLSDINPACVQPNLRKVLLHTLNDLSHSGSTRNKEQAALLLASLIATAPKFFIPYSQPILHILLPRIRSALPASLRSALAVNSFSRLQNSTLNSYGKDTDSSSSSSYSLFPMERVSESTQLIQNMILTTQLAANATSAAANAVATAILTSGSVVDGLNYLLTNNNNNITSHIGTVPRRIPINHLGTNQITSALINTNAISMVTRAATAAQAAVKAVIAAAEHNTTGGGGDGDVFTMEGKNTFINDMLSNNYMEASMVSSSLINTNAISMVTRAATAAQAAVKAVIAAAEHNTTGGGGGGDVFTMEGKNTFINDMLSNSYMEASMVSSSLINTNAISMVTRAATAAQAAVKAVIAAAEHNTTGGGGGGDVFTMEGKNTFLNDMLSNSYMEASMVSSSLINTNAISMVTRAATAAQAAVKAVIAAAEHNTTGGGGGGDVFTMEGKNTFINDMLSNSYMEASMVSSSLINTNAISMVTRAATAAQAAVKAVIAAAEHNTTGGGGGGDVFTMEGKNTFLNDMLSNSYMEASMYNFPDNLKFDFNRDNYFNGNFPPGGYYPSYHINPIIPLINHKNIIPESYTLLYNQYYSLDFNLSKLYEYSSTNNNQWNEPTSVIVALFTILGRLAFITPHSIYTYMDEFIPILAYMMQDTSCYLKRSIAVWTLTKLVSYTGYVVSPYKRYPQLLTILLGMLKREEIKCIRQEVLRALGVLGALDPFKFKLYSGEVDTYGDTGIAVSHHEVVERKDVDITQSELVINLSWESRDIFFSVCALSALIHLLRDPALHTQYGSIVHTIVYVLKLLGPRSVYYLRQLIPDYFRCLENTRDVRLQEFLIRQLGNVMTIVRLHTKEFAHEVVDLLITHWWIAPNVQHACINLLSPMSCVLGAEFRTYLTRLMPTILRTLHHESNEMNLIALLEILPEFGYTLEDYAHILVPAIANLIDINNETNLSILLNSVSDNLSSSISNPIGSFMTSVSTMTSIPSTLNIDSTGINLSNILGSVSDNNNNNNMTSSTNHDSTMNTTLLLIIIIIH
ncbi:unnamed protein product [Heterobilharzia americana]|nr:unnamed protein product [Heterobilharzia americana]